MNRKTAIELGGRVFQIEEAAITEIEAYLSALKRSFGKEADAAEIIDDIESRMSELFAHKTGMNRPITLEDAQAVLAVMGAPADIGGEQTESIHEPIPGAKRLFRHPDDQVVAGVCSGLGAYFGIDPVWIRLAFAFALFSFGTGLLLYLVLIFIVPEASTPAERLMMHGEAVTLENMEHRLKTEGRKVQDNLKRSFNNPLSRGLSGLVKALVKSLRYILWTAAFTFTAGLGILLLLVFWNHTTITLGGVSVDGIASVNALFRSAFEAELCIELLALLLILWLAGLLLQLFRKPGNNQFTKKINLLLSVATSLVLLSLTILWFLNAGAYQEQAVYRQQHVYPQTDTLFITCNQANQNEHSDLTMDASPKSAAGIILYNTSMEIVRYSDTLLRMEIVNFSMGPNADSAYQLAATLPEGFKYNARNLHINNRIQLKPGTPFRGQQRHIRLSIPNNTIVIKDRNAASLQRQEHAGWWEEFSENQR
ncbi:MAG: hypothetical protein RL160_1924 [Bacteroidota bacterium]|jgi:phage shock protein C